MTATTVFESLQSRGFSFQIAEERLMISPASQLTETDRQTIRQYKPDLLTLMTSACKTCGGIVYGDSGEGWRHSWCSAGCFDTWEAAEGWLLTEFQPGTSNASMRVGELLAIRHCPDGCGKMAMQDSIHDIWFCAACNLWVIAGKVILLRA